MLFENVIQFLGTLNMQRFFLCRVIVINQNFQNICATFLEPPHLLYKLNMYVCHLLKFSNSPLCLNSKGFEDFQNIFLYKSKRMSVCVYRRISLTAEPIWFSFTMQLLIGPVKVYNYFGGGYYHLLKRYCLQKKITTTTKIQLKLKLRKSSIGSTDPPFSQCPLRPLGANPLVCMYSSLFNNRSFTTPTRNISVSYICCAASLQGHVKGQKFTLLFRNKNLTIQKMDIEYVDIVTEQLLS